MESYVPDHTKWLAIGWGSQDLPSQPLGFQGNLVDIAHNAVNLMIATNLRLSPYLHYVFLVACRRLINLLCRSLPGRSVRNTLLFWRFWASFALLLLPKCLVSLFYHCPCPPARDFGSHVSGIFFLSYFFGTPTHLFIKIGPSVGS